MPLPHATALSEPQRPQDEILFHTALRGFAAIMVILYHCSLAHKSTDLGLLSTFIRQGYVFVDVFFLLSGFILMRQYKSFFDVDLKKSTRSFLRRRFLRIYPPYAFWLLISILAWFVLQPFNGTVAVPADAHFRSIFAHIFMVQSILGTRPEYNTPLWSIAVEFIAYCTLPFSVLLFRPLGTAILTGLIGIFLAVVFAFIALFGTIDVIEGAGSVVRALLGFTLGGLACLVTGRFPDATGDLGRKLGLAAFAGVIVAFGLGLVFAGYVVALALIAISSTNQGRLSRLAALRLPQTIGRISFSIYLCHVPVLGALILVTAKIEAMSGVPLFSNFPVFATIVVAACIAVAYPSYSLIEVRLRALLS